MDRPPQADGSLITKQLLIRAYLVLGPFNLSSYIGVLFYYWTNGYAGQWIRPAVAYLPLSNGDGPGGSSIYANWQLIYDALIDPLRLQDATFYQPHDLGRHCHRIIARASHCICTLHAGFYRYWSV